MSLLSFSCLAQTTLCVYTDCKDTFQLPQTSISLNGSITTNNTFSSLQWKQVAGTTVSIANPLVLNTSFGPIKNSGTYIYSLTATTGSGITKIGYDTIVVLPVNKVPVAIIKPSTTSITLPVNTVTLDGSSSYDSDGIVTNYLWSNGSTSSSISPVFGAAGTYNFSLTVTDNNGATNTTNTSIVVNPAIILPPILSLSYSSIVNGTSDTLIVTAIDPNQGGTIKQYGWGKLSGSGTQSIVGASTPKAIITGLQGGTYQYKVTVWNGAGLTSSAIATFTVNQGNRYIIKVVTYFSDGSVITQQ
jgi:hypothetical protein